MTSYLLIMLTISMLFALSMVGLYRNGLTLKARLRAISIASERAKADIHNGVDDWIHRYEELEAFGSYEAMAGDLSKWTFEQFYPNYEVTTK